jgi:hypothetical protein
MSLRSCRIAVSVASMCKHSAPERVPVMSNHFSAIMAGLSPASFSLSLPAPPQSRGARGNTWMPATSGYESGEVIQSHRNTSPIVDRTVRSLHWQPRAGFQTRDRADVSTQLSYELCGAVPRFCVKGGHISRHILRPGRSQRRSDHEDEIPSSCCCHRPRELAVHQDHAVTLNEHRPFSRGRRRVLGGGGRYLLVAFASRRLLRPRLQRPLSAVRNRSATTAPRRQRCE